MKKYQQILLCVFAALLILAGTAFAVVYRGYFVLPTQGKAELAGLREESYNGIYLSMMDDKYYDTDVFLTYRGLDVRRIDTRLRWMRDIHEYVDTAYASANAEKIQVIYLGLDPEIIARETFGKPERFTTLLKEHLGIYLEAHPNVLFEITLPYHSLDYWVGMSEQKRTDLLEYYVETVCTICEYPNVQFFFAGCEEWLIANDANYEDEGSCRLNSELTQELQIIQHCDRIFTTDAYSIGAQIATLENLIETKENGYDEQKKLNDTVVIALGDSIFGNYTGSTSITTALEEISSADVYNLGIGGVPGSADPLVYDFTEMVDILLSEDILNTKLTEANFPEGDKLRGEVYTAAAKALRRASKKNDRIVILIEYGLNDFFGGHPVGTYADKDENTYAGALRIGIEKLKAAYPDAEITVIAPGRTTYFGWGSEPQGKDGGRMIDYTKAAIDVANAAGVFCFNLLTDTGIDDDNFEYYSFDGVHYNYRGRYLIAKELSHMLHEM